MVTITATHVASPLVMPTAAELRILSKQVLTACPKLASVHVTYERDFADAFYAVGQFGRLPDIERSNVKSVGYWCELARDILANVGRTLDVPGHLLVAAALAHGDIPHSFNPARYPFEFSLGLTFPSAGIPPADAWRRVLATGQLRPASSSPNRQDWSPGLTRVDGRNYPIGLVSTWQSD